LAVAKEEAARKERQEMWLDEASRAAFMSSTAFRYWNRIQSFKSLVVQVFTRDITIDHSKEDAARILFIEHKDGTGSGWLPIWPACLPLRSI